MWIFSVDAGDDGAMLGGAEAVVVAEGVLAAGEAQATTSAMTTDGKRRPRIR